MKLLREQIRGKNTREVYTGDAARELGIDVQTTPGHLEYEKHLADLELAGYLQPHWNPSVNSQ